MQMREITVGVRTPEGPQVWDVHYVKQTTDLHICGVWLHRTTQEIAEQKWRDIAPVIAEEIEHTEKLLE